MNSYEKFKNAENTYDLDVVESDYSNDDYEWNDLTDDVKERLLNEVREILESYYKNHKDNFMYDLEFCQEYGCTSGCVYSTEKWQELLRLTEEENLDFYLFCKYDIANEYKKFAKTHKITEIEIEIEIEKNMESRMETKRNVISVLKNASNFCEYDEHYYVSQITVNDSGHIEIKLTGNIMKAMMINIPLTEIDKNKLEKLVELTRLFYHKGFTVELKEITILY